MAPEYWEVSPSSEPDDKSVPIDMVVEGRKPGGPFEGHGDTTTSFNTANDAHSAQSQTDCGFLTALQYLRTYADVPKVHRKAAYMRALSVLRNALPQTLVDPDTIP